jgi:hypothetical protein
LCSLDDDDNDDGDDDAVDYDTNCDDAGDSNDCCKLNEDDGKY